jgi:hypothetical protein
MTSFQSIFGGTTVKPSSQTYLELALDDDVTLKWPIEQMAGENVVADIVNVAAAVDSLSITLPDARAGSTGYSLTVVNSGSRTFTVKTSTGSSIVTPAAGTAWVIYLRSNSNAAGSWGTFQLGATTSSAQASALAGQGLTANAGLLDLNSPMSDVSTSPYAVLDTARGNSLRWTGAVGTFTLATRGNGWFCYVYNDGSGALTLDPDSGTIDGASTVILQAGEACRLITNGTDWFTIATGGGSGGSAFDYTSFSVAGSGNYTLSGAELDKIAYNLTGILTANRTIIVPASVQQYWISNATTGAFSLYVKTAAQSAPGIEVLQGTKAILYCDGTNVLDADTGTVTFPIAIAQGGTGGTTQAAARTGLGSGAVGDTLFTATTTSSAQDTLGASATGKSLFTAADAATARATLAAAGIGVTNNFAADQYLGGTNPALVLTEATGAANNKAWAVQNNSSGSSLRIAAQNDAGDTRTTFMELLRSAMTPTKARLAMPRLDIDYSTTTYLYMRDSSQAANNQKWAMYNAGSALYLSAVTDDEATAEFALKAERSGVDVTVLTLNGTSIDLSGYVTSAQSWVLKRRSSDASKTITITPTADDTLTVAVTTGLYLIEGLLIIGANVGGSQGFQFNLNHSAAAMELAYTIDGYVNGAAVTTNSALGRSFATQGSTVQFSNLTLTTINNAVAFKGAFTSTSAGNVRVLWAQYSSSANDTFLMTGSYLSVRRISA